MAEIPGPLSAADILALANLDLARRAAHGDQYASRALDMSIQASDLVAKEALSKQPKEEQKTEGDQPGI